MSPTLNDLIELNTKTLRILNGSFKTLRDSLPGQDPDDKAETLAEMGRISLEINTTTNVLIHLHAAETVVEEMSSENQRKLDELARAIDNAIMRQAWVDAGLGLIEDLVDAAVKVRKITASHT
jgi:hypothetical protein